MMTEGNTIELKASPQLGASSSSQPPVHVTLSDATIGPHKDERAAESSTSSLEEGTLADVRLDQHPPPSVIPMTTRRRVHFNGQNGSLPPPPTDDVIAETTTHQNGGAVASADDVTGGDDERVKTTEDPASADTEFEWCAYSYVYLANACCELLHYREAALVVGGLESVTVLAWIAMMIALYSSGTVAISFLPMLAQAAVMALAAVSIGLMVFGVVRERPVFIWPHMAMQLALITSGILFTVTAVVTMAAGSDWADQVFGILFGGQNIPLLRKVLGPIWPFCLAVIFDFSAAVGIWFYILVRGAYDFLEDKRFFESAAANTAIVVPNGAYAVVGKHANDGEPVAATNGDAVKTAEDRL